MADNPNIDLAQEIMIERFGLEETTYRMESFSETSKGDISIRMSDGFIPVTAKFPSSFLEFEKVRKMSVDEKRARFNTYLPKWNDLPMEMRLLFADVADNVDDLDDLPTLRDPNVTVTQDGAGQVTISIKKPVVKNKMKPKVKKGA